MGNGGEALVQSLYDVVVEPIIYLMLILAGLFFVWGVIEFIAGAGSEEKRRTGQKHIMWGVIGIAIMVSVFGIARFVSNSLPPGAEIPIELEN